MKHFLVYLTILSFLCSSSYASCDWSKIKKTSNNSYTMDHKLFLCVGAIVQDNAIKAKQIDDYVKALSLKDLSIQDADKKTKDWSDAATSLEKRLQDLDKLDKDANFLYFAGGILTSILVGFAVAGLSGR